VARVLCAGYLKGFGTAAVFWIAAIFVPPPARFWVWGIALAIDLATPYVMRREQARVPLDVSHLPERFGLFTILVLGESIAAAIVGLGHVHWDFVATVTTVVGVVVATSLWWIYFDNLDGFNIRRRGDERNWRPTVWIYSHLPLAISIAVAGVGVEHAIVAAAHPEEWHDAERWLLVGAVGLALLSMAVILEASIRPDDRDTGDIIRARLIGVACLAVVGLLGVLGPLGVVCLVAVVVVGQVVADFVLSNRTASDEIEAG
jgi:low temperature requirement protein LtrA